MNYQAKIADIICMVAMTLDVHLHEIISRTRVRRVVDARHIAIRLSYDAVGGKVSLSNIGRAFAITNHSSVISSMRVSGNLIKYNKDFRDKYYRCRMAMAIDAGADNLEFLNKVPQY